MMEPNKQQEENNQENQGRDKMPGGGKMGEKKAPKGETKKLAQVEVIVIAGVAATATRVTKKREKEKTPTKYNSNNLPPHLPPVAPPFDPVEKKRSRERQRRSEVNRGLDELLKLVFKVDPQVKLDAEARAAEGSGVYGGRNASSLETGTLLSRVELINTVVEVFRRVQEENEERKVVITQLTKDLTSGNRSGGIVQQAAMAPSPAASFPTVRDIQQRQQHELQQQQQELQRRVELEALLRSASAGIRAEIQQALQGNSLPETSALGGLITPSLAQEVVSTPVAAGLCSLPETSALGTLGGAPALERDVASLSTHPSPDAAATGLLSLAREKRTATHQNPLLDAISSLPTSVAERDLSVLYDRAGLGGDRSSTLYQAIRKRCIQDEENAALAAAGFAPIGSGNHSSLELLDRASGPSSLLSRASNSLRSATSGEQTIAEAAANELGDQEGPALKRFKERRYGR